MELLFLALLGFLPFENQTKPFFHAHNDFLHTRPLLDALEQGFDSVEADVFLVNNQLMVAHFLWDIKPIRTLENLYLEPLARLHKEGKLKNIWLMVDIKSKDAEATAILLHQQLKRYPGLFQEINKNDKAPVKVLLSGNTPRDWVLSEKNLLIRLDGREADLGEKNNAKMIPWVSEPWSKHFSWKGTGPISDQDNAKLKSMAAKASSANQQLRFWGAPDTPAGWNIQYSARVQRISSDNLKGLAKQQFD